MKNRLSLLLLLVTFLSFAQNKFEPGYYIDNSGIKTECLIKNYDWKNNPKRIEIKSSNQDESIINKNIDEISEFAVNGKSKFIKATVNIDDSSQNITTLSYSPTPKFVEKTLFLKVLVEGNSNLYHFENEDYERFFYSLKGNIEQLIYKQYTNSDGNITANDAFKQQLFVNFKCNTTDKNSILSLKYYISDLIDYFIKTNNCISGKTESKIISEKRNFQTNFKINLLFNSINSNYVIPNGSIRGNYESKKRNTLSFGFEAESILPYSNKNWSFIFDPSFINNKESLKIYKPQFINPDFTLRTENFMIRFPLGLRRYFILNESNKLFVNASFSINAFKTYVDSYNPYNNSTKVLVDDNFTSSNFAIGAGYQFKKYTAEIKFHTKTSFYSYAVSGQEFTLNQISLKLGYKLF